MWVAISAGEGTTPKWHQMAPLDPTDSNYTDGAWFMHTSRLPAGSYRFRFAAQTGDRAVGLLAPAGKHLCAGPTVAQANPVVLSSGYVTPTRAPTATNFTWRVKYWNTDNAAPDSVQVAIWFPTLKRTTGTRCGRYDPADTNCKDGKWYTFSRKWLPAGRLRLPLRRAAGNELGLLAHAQRAPTQSGPTVNP